MPQNPGSSHGRRNLVCKVEIKSTETFRIFMLVWDRNVLGFMRQIAVHGVKSPKLERREDLTCLISVK